MENGETNEPPSRGVGRTARVRRDTTPRDCDHVGKPHQHGTRAAYVSDRCGCILCRTANSRAEQVRTAAMALGRWQPFVDAQPVHDHLLRIRDEGLGIRRIAELSGVHRSTIQRLLTKPSRPQRVRPETAERLLSVRCEAVEVSPRRQIDAEDTSDRLRTLIAAGHTVAELAQALGKSSSNLRRTMRRGAVTVKTAASVEALYRRLTANPMNHQREPNRDPHGHSRGQIRLSQPPSASGCLMHNCAPSGWPTDRSSIPTGAHHAAMPYLKTSSSACRGFPDIALRLNQPMPHKPGPGRPSKGARDQFSVRPAVEVGDVLREKARAAGMFPAEYCAFVLCEAMGMPEYAPTPSLISADQPSLPLSKSA